VRFSIGASGGAQAQIDELKARAIRSPGTNHEKVWLALKQVLEALPLDMVALRRDNMLKRDLAHVWREKCGRWRIFYLVSSERQRVVVLALLPGRKQGDKSDPYVLFAKMIKHGDFDQQFAELGVSKPT
jgi:hypothetical protein